MNDNLRQRVEALGPAERLIQALLAHSDHMVHNRPGIVTPAPGTPAGVKWEAASYKVEGEGAAAQKIAFFNRKVGTKTQKVRAGVIHANGTIHEGGRVVGQYRQPGFFPEVAAWMYRQIADIYALDNEFVARWASYAFAQEHRDLKVALCAFLLVQPRTGEPVFGDERNAEGKRQILFYDEDYRDVGEAMCLIRRKDGRDLNPKLLLRVGDFLRLPVIAAINRELGFGKSAKNPTLGRWPKAVGKYLCHRERNPKMLAGLVKSGMRTTVMALSERAHYKPDSPRFYEILRWKQAQAPDGRRTIAIGVDVAAAESWADLSEADICRRIVETRQSYKRIVGMVPPTIGLTRAIVAAAVESGAMSEQDLIIATPTLEELGLLGVEPVKSKWEAAIKNAENQRAANIAQRVKNKDTQEKLDTAAASAIKKAVEEVVRGMMIYVIVDISSSMQDSIARAKEHIAKLLGGFPLEKLRVSVFNSSGREVVLKHPSKAGVEAAFRGIAAGGSTDYGAGVRALTGHAPAADEDALFIFVGDNDPDNPNRSFAHQVQMSGIKPVALALVEVSNGRTGRVVDVTARDLGVPCFRIEEGIFNDPYSIPRTLRNLIAAAPVGQGLGDAPRQTARVSLVEQILKTDLLQKPAA